MTYYNGSGRGGFLSFIPPVVKNLVAINVLLFIATCINENFMIANFAMFYPASHWFRPWQILTHMFMHRDSWHIFFNMYTLMMFGTVLENRIGSKKFLIFYFVTGLGAVALHTGVQWLQAQYYISVGNAAAYMSLLNIKTLGASGAIFGVLIGFAMCFPESRLTLLFPPVTMTVKWYVIIFAVIELFTGITGIQSGIAHFAHLGGMLFGWLLIRWWKRHGQLY